MKAELEKYRGIHPGLILEHELKRRKISKNQFAIAIAQPRQTINAITKGKRKLPTALSFKIDRELGLEEGTMLLFQTYFEISDYQKTQHLASGGFDLGILRKELFWDTDFNTLHWNKNAEAIIRRVFERGNMTEKNFIIEQYGTDYIRETLGVSPDSLIHLIDK